MTAPSSEQVALARKIQDLALTAIDELNADIARERLVGGPCCKGVAVHPGDYRLATRKFAAHDCYEGLQCDDCVNAARQRFADTVELFGHAHCPRCGRDFTDYDAFTTFEEL